MYATVRPYFTGGIALVGASVIAVSPIAPPLPDIHVPSPAQVASSVELAAFVNPITTLVDAIQTSINNLATTGGQALADPFPVLQQIGVNGLGYAGIVGTAAQGIASALGSIATTTLPSALQTAFSQVAAGDVAGAVTTLNNALTGAALGIALPLAPVFSIPSQIAQHVLNVANVFSGLPLGLGIGVLSTVEGTFFQFGTSVQGIVDAVRAGDAVTALSGLINGPVQIAGAFLNGVPSQGFVGILSPALGLLNQLAVQIPQQIAQALAPAAATTTLAALKAPTALPSLAPKLVTLPTTADSTAATTADSTAATAASTAGSLKTKRDGTRGERGAMGAKHTRGERGATDAKHAKGRDGVAKTHSKNDGGHRTNSGSHTKSGSHK